jgi:hypothetical protein
MPEPDEPLPDQRGEVDLQLDARALVRGCRGEEDIEARRRLHRRFTFRA